MQSSLLAAVSRSAWIAKHGIAFFLALSFLPWTSIPSDARGLGRFLGSLVARGVAREAIVAGHSQSPSYTEKIYTADVLTVSQLARCIKKAGKLDEDSGRLEFSRNEFQSLESEINRTHTTIELERSRVNHYSQKAVDAFNMLVDRHNMLVTTGKAKQAKFNALVEAHNSEANAYNKECVKKYYADDLSEAQKLAAQP